MRAAIAALLIALLLAGCASIERGPSGSYGVDEGDDE